MATKDEDYDLTEKDDGSAVVRVEGEADERRDDRREDDEERDESTDAAGDDAAAESEGENEAEREKIRERRRLERHNKKDRIKAREEANARELKATRDQNAALAARLAALEQRGQSTDMAQLDAAIKNEADGVAYFRNQIANASASGDHAAVADATEKLTTALVRGRELVAHKKNAVDNQRQQTNRVAAVDPRVANFASQWASRNKWYDPQRGDLDSRITFEVDKEVAAAGYIPNTQEYWDELDARLATHLPHRMRVQSNGKAPRSPVDGGGRESGSSARSGEYTLSADRVKAIKEAGRWEDLAERKKAINSYREYDKNASARK